MAAKKKLPTHAELAKRYGVTRQTLTTWKADGLNIYDPKAVKEKIAAMKRRSERSTKLDGIRERKLEAEARREEIKAEKEAGSVVSFPEFLDAIRRIGGAMDGALARLEADLPPILEGMSPAQMQKAIRSKAGEIRALLKDETSDLWQQLQD